MKELRLLQRIWIISLLVVSPIGILIFSSSLTQATDLCGVTITADTKLDQDLNCSGDGIIIGADDITLDCDGHTISCNGSNCRCGIECPSVAAGIFLNSRTGSTIINCQVTNFEVSFFLESSSTNTLMGNSTILDSEGFLLEFSNNNTLIGNTGTSDILSSFFLSVSSNNILDKNTAYYPLMPSYFPKAFVLI